MRNNNTTKSAWVANRETGEGFRVEFPMDHEELRSTWRDFYALDVFGEGESVFIDEVCGFYGFASLFDNLDELNDMAFRLERLEDDDAEKLEAMAEYCDNLDDIENAWEDSYFIPDTTLADYAEELCYECGYMPSELPSWISYHIDWEGVGRELSFDGYSEINGGVLYVAQ